MLADDLSLQCNDNSHRQEHGLYVHINCCGQYADLQRRSHMGCHTDRAENLSSHFVLVAKCGTPPKRDVKLLTDHLKLQIR